MYFTILKKDLKRKKVMNIILVLFVILSVMFASSSVNNIVTVTVGLDYFFNKSEMSDYYFITSEFEGNDSLSEILSSEPTVTSFKKEPLIFMTSENIRKGGKKLDISSNAIVMSVNDAKIKFFDSENNVIENVEKGKVYVSGNVIEKSAVGVGDIIEISLNDTTVNVEYAGLAKDAFLGSDMMENPRFILNDEDYREFTKNENTNMYYMGGIYYVNTSDTYSLEKAVSENENIMFSGDKNLIKMTYIMNMIVAGILLVVSVCLILVSFVVLRFTIGFTIEEEFREIGVMKALGLKNFSIRALYLIKYLGISLIGAVFGYAAGVPFGNMMLGSISKKMYLGNDSDVLIGVISSIAVIAVIMLFCFGCTSKIKKMSPIDAVRSGQTGERYGRKNGMRLSASKSKVTPFLAVNDILSSPRQFGIITAVFTLSTLLVMILANTANTLDSEKMLSLFNVTESDAYISVPELSMDYVAGIKDYEETMSDVEKKLLDNGIPCDALLETYYKVGIKKDEKETIAVFLHCRSTKASDYTYTEGSAPRYENEIALSQPVADKLGAGVGDKVRISLGGEDREFIITAFFQTLNQLGECGRFYEDLDLSDAKISGTMSVQINYTDSPDENTKEQRLEKLKEIYESENIFVAAEYARDCTAVSDIISSVKNLILIITLIITALIAVLMERSFISKEKSEIALMKAIGFKTSAVVIQHTLRFTIVSAAAAVLAAALCMPLTKLAIDPIFAMMGAVSGVEYVIAPAEIFAVYPVVIIAVTAAAAFMTSLYTGSIKASDTANIE